MAEAKSVWKDLWQVDMTLLYNSRFWLLTVLRLFLGILFAYHGFLRLFVPGNLKGSAIYFTQVGLPLPVISSFLFGVIELVGGVLLFFGLITRWTSVVLIIEMLVAFLFVHLKNGLLVSNNGYEFILLLVAALIVVLVNGAGHLAFGRKLGKKWE